MTRPDWNTYFLGIAEAVAARSDCERSKVGAVVVKDRRLRGAGYNGAPAGRPGCETCPRRTSEVAPGSGYDSGPGVCVAVHAEANAILYCDRADLSGATLYVTRAPCANCSKLIEAAGITDVVYPGESIDGIHGNYSLKGFHGYLETVVVPKPKGYTLEDLAEMRRAMYEQRLGPYWQTEYFGGATHRLVAGVPEDHIIRGEN